MEKLSDNTQTTFEDIRRNYLGICENIARSGREVRIMAVTKTVSFERINYALDLGVSLLGENRVQEYLDKRENYKPAEVHFIGGLQTNKVKYIIDKVSMIHSVDSMRLAEEINRRAAQHGIIMDILTEINIGEEQTKGGITADSAGEFCAKMQELFEHLKVENAHNRENAMFDTLSMGMSGDYETAIKYEATIVRIGSGLFGYRKYL